MQISNPDGAFFALIDVERAIEQRFHGDDIAFAGWLLDEHRVSVVPGTDFGARGPVRISFATDDHTIERGLDTFFTALDRIS